MGQHRSASDREADAFESLVASTPHPAPAKRAVSRKPRTPAQRVAVNPAPQPEGPVATLSPEALTEVRMALNNCRPLMRRHCLAEHLPAERRRFAGDLQGRIDRATQMIAATRTPYGLPLIRDALAELRRLFADLDGALARAAAAKDTSERLFAEDLRKQAKAAWRLLSPTPPAAPPGR